MASYQVSKVNRRNGLPTRILLAFANHGIKHHALDADFKPEMSEAKMEAGTEAEGGSHDVHASLRGRTAVGLTQDSQLAL